MITASSFFRQATLLFLALRAADLVNLAAGMWLVPRFVDREELGVVLPVVTFTTTLSLPAFAFAFVLMKESNRLAAIREFGRLKSLLRGAFVGTSALFAISVAVSLSIIPFFIKSMDVKDPSVVILAVTAGFLGCFAPVYQDALNGLKRFGAYGLAEITAATARIAVMALVMPFQALFGFFAGNTAQPLVRIVVSLVAMRNELSVKSESYWKSNPLPRIVPIFFGVLAALLMPMLASLGEQSLIRTMLATEFSADYYLMTRLADLLNYLTLPILLVLFPYAAESAKRGESTRPLVLKCTFAALVGALALAIVYGWRGDVILGWMSSLAHENSKPKLLLLLAINLLTAFQVFYTNAEIAAGRFRFLLWFIPLHLVYILYLPNLPDLLTLQNLLLVFLAFAAIRASCVLFDIIRST